MNKLGCIIIVIVLFSCKSNSIAQEKTIGTKKPTSNVSKEDKPKPKIPGFGDLRDNKNGQIDPKFYQQIEPGTIHFTGLVMEFYKSSTICDRPYKAALKVRIKSIIKSGPGIVNLLSQNQEITVGFVNGVYTKDLDVLQSKMTIDKMLSIKVKEGLCPNLGNDTVYEIVRFEEK